MWKQRSHVLIPLAKLAGKPQKKWKQEKEHEDTFKEEKRMVAREAMMSQPDFTKPFHVCTDASNHQLGSAIMKVGKPLAFHTHKLSEAQSKHSTGEKELLGIVERLKSFENVLLGQEVIVHTDD